MNEISMITNEINSTSAIKSKYCPKSFSINKTDEQLLENDFEIRSSLSPLKIFERNELLEFSNKHIKSDTSDLFSFSNSANADNDCKTEDLDKNDKNSDQAEENKLDNDIEEDNSVRLYKWN